MNPYHYIVSFAKGVGGIIRDASLILRPNFNDMANLSLTSPSNGSAVFNGSSDYVQTNQPPSTGAASFTFSAWVYVKSHENGDGVIMSEEAVGWGLQGIALSTSSNIGFYAGTGTAGTSLIVSPSGSLPANTWTFITCTHTPTANNIYINGSLVATAGAANLVTTAGTNYHLGKYANTYYLDGNLANVAVWNRALTSDEINSIMWKRYDLLTAGESTGLVAWYALDDITGTSVPDSTGTYNATAY
jgi:hypothetical protein